MALRFTIPTIIKKVALSLITLATFTTSHAQLTYQVGNGTTVNGSSAYPAPMGHYFESDRHQLLFRASEMQAAGMSAGAILAIAWNVKSLNTCTVVPVYSIKIGTTTANDLSSWIGGISHMVYGISDYVPTVGINTFTLSTPFTWNGTDNIVIETCQGDGTLQWNTNLSFENTVYSYTASRQFYQDDVPPVCNTTNFYTYNPTWKTNTIFTMGLPCIDTPKTSVFGPIRVCPKVPFDLRPKDYYADAEYSWEYSFDGTNWANFTGVPTVSGAIKDSITVPKWYRVTVKCKANTNLKYRTQVHKVDIAPFYYCYCDNGVTSDVGADIGNVTIINTNKFDTAYGKRVLVTGTGLPVYSNSNANRKYTGYHDSLGWPCLYRDTNYIFNITQIHSGSTFETGVLQAYLDYNRDGLYNPNTERIFVKALDGTGSTPYIAQLPVTVPSTAQIGPTGLRIIISKDTVKAAPCDTISGGGEVEDYIVEICHRPCDAPVNAGIVVSTDSSMCLGYEYTLTDTTYEKARSGFSRAWQISGDDKTWFNVNGSAGKDTLERVFGGQPLYYRLRTICHPTQDTNYSAATKINVKPGYKCYCYSKAIGGKGVDTSDIGGVSIAAYSNNNGGPHLLNPVAVYPRTDYTDIDPIEIFTDSVYKFYVYHTMPVAEHGDAKVTIFMDFNNDHKYDIPEERIYTGYTAIGNHTLVDNVIVPLKAITDVPTGMRVILNNNVGPNRESDTACGAYVSGETEDYIIMFRKKWGVGINEVTQLTAFSVYPNPTNGRVNVQFNSQSDIKNVTIRVTAVTGQLVQEHVQGHMAGMFYKELDMTGNAAGVYFVELQADGEKMMKKLIVQ